ncbi:MAG: hypothetical protein ACR2F1_07375 [Nitrososphaeraceae archaeon]
MNSDIEWNDVIKKEARGIDDEDLGEVQEVQGNYVLVQKGIINKEKFYIPKDQAESYDGDALRFRFSEQELNQYQGEPSSTQDSDSMQETTSDERETDEESIPLTEKDWMYLKSLKRIKQQLLKNQLQKLKLLKFL